MARARARPGSREPAHKTRPDEHASERTFRQLHAHVVYAVLLLEHRLVRLVGAALHARAARSRGYAASALARASASKKSRPAYALERSPALVAHTAGPNPRPPSVMPRPTASFGLDPRPPSAWTRGLLRSCLVHLRSHRCPPPSTRPPASYPLDRSLIDRESDLVNAHGVQQVVLGSRRVAALVGQEHRGAAEAEEAVGHDHVLRPATRPTTSGVGFQGHARCAYARGPCRCSGTSFA